MFLNLDRYRLKKSALALVATFGLAATAHAVPVSYSFVTGTPGFGTGSVAGLFGTGETAFGTFTYEAVSPIIGPANFATGTGLSYANITNWEGFVGGRRFFDGLAGTIVGNGVGVGGGDIYGLSGTVLGAAWEPFSVGGNSLVLAQMFWTESAQTGDFLGSDDLLATLPSFPGVLRLSFGTDASHVTGAVQFGGLVVRPTAVPEPGMLLLLSMGLPMLLLVRRRSNRA